MKKKIIIGSFLLLTLCSCSIFGNRSRQHCLNINNELDFFKEELTGYIDTIGKFLNQNPDNKKYTDEYNTDKILNFEDEYVWKWFIELGSSESFDYYDAIKQSNYDEYSRRTYDQLFIIYHQNTSLMYV